MILARAPKFNFTGINVGRARPARVLVDVVDYAHLSEFGGGWDLGWLAEYFICGHASIYRGARARNGVRRCQLCSSSEAPA